jgi:stearoyl-CoA desaturase (delta-9 desaturase)
LVAAWHGTFAINSFGHGPSRLRRFATNDDSRNSFLLALLTCGEGWHNNHHHRMGLARHGLAWWEVDLSYGVICLLEALGLVWDVRRPGLEASTTPAGSEKSPAMTVSAEAKTSSPVVETYRKPSPSLA